MPLFPPCAETVMPSRVHVHVHVHSEHAHVHAVGGDCPRVVILVLVLVVLPSSECCQGSNPPGSCILGTMQVRHPYNNVISFHADIDAPVHTIIHTYTCIGVSNSMV